MVKGRIDRAGFEHGTRPVETPAPPRPKSVEPTVPKKAAEQESIAVRTQIAANRKAEEDLRAAHLQSQFHDLPSQSAEESGLRFKQMRERLGTKLSGSQRDILKQLENPQTRALALQSPRTPDGYNFTLDDRKLFGSNTSRFEKIATSIATLETSSQKSELPAKLEALKSNYARGSAEGKVIDRAIERHEASSAPSTKGVAGSKLSEELNQLEAEYQKSAPQKPGRSGALDAQRARFEQARYLSEAKLDEAHKMIATSYGLKELPRHILSAETFVHDFASQFDQPHLVISKVGVPGHAMLAVGNGATGEYRFFDPNWGVFLFHDPKKMADFVSRYTGYGDTEGKSLTTREINAATELSMSQSLSSSGQRLGEGICLAMSLNVAKWFSEHPDFKGDLSKQNVGLREFEPVEIADRFLQDRSFSDAAFAYLYQLDNVAKQPQDESLKGAEELARSSKKEDWQRALDATRGITPLTDYARAIAGLAESKLAAGKDFQKGGKPFARLVSPQWVDLHRILPGFDSVQDASRYAIHGLSTLDNRSTASLLLDAARSKPGLAKSLVEAGANINSKDNLGMTPIFSAQTAREAKELIEAGADLSVRNNFSKTVLFPLITQLDPQLIRTLIEHGADPNAKDKFGRTPLYVTKSVDAIKALIEGGADVNARDPTGDTPLDYATTKEIEDALIAAGARH